MNQFFDIERNETGWTTQVQLVLKQHTTLESGSVAVGPQLTAGEVDIFFDQLRQELDRAESKAKVITQ
jgi:hypothetical protein